MNIQTSRVAMTCTAGLLPCVLAYPLSSCVHSCSMSQERSISTLPNELLRLILEYLHPREDEYLWITHCKSLLSLQTKQTVLTWSLQAYLDDIRQGVQHACSVRDVYWSIVLMKQGNYPPFWNDYWIVMAGSVDYTWPNPRSRDNPNLQCCHVGPVNYVLAHLVGACSLPWHKAVGPVQRRPKCLCHIRDKRGVFAWTMALAMKLGKDQFIKKLKEVINVPSLEWLHTSYITGTRGSKWLLQTLLDINRLSKGSSVHASSTEENPGTEMAACAKDVYEVWLSDIVKPLQERILKVLACFVQVTPASSLHSTSSSGKSIAEGINDLLSDNHWLTGTEVEAQHVRAMLQETAAQCRTPDTDVARGLVGRAPFQSELCEPRSDPEKLATTIMSRSLVGVVLSFSPLQVAEYLVEKGHLQPLTSPVSRALQAHSMDLSLPITAFCYKDSEKKSRKVAVLEHVIAVCRHLREKGDFLSLKYLLSAVRASVSQRHQTHVSWKCISDKGCRHFKELEDVMSFHNGYKEYRQTVQVLTTRFVPFLPAHQVHVHRSAPPSSPSPAASLQLQEWTGLKEYYSEAVSQQQGMDFLFVDLGLQLQAALEAWNILKQWKTYYM